MARALTVVDCDMVQLTLHADCAGGDCGAGGAGEEAAGGLQEPHAAALQPLPVRVGRRADPLWCVFTTAVGFRIPLALPWHELIGCQGVACMISELSTPAGTAAKPDMLDTFQEQLFPAFQVVLQVRTAMTLRCVGADTLQSSYFETASKPCALHVYALLSAIKAPNAAAFAFDSMADQRLYMWRRRMSRSFTHTSSRSLRSS